MENKKEFFPGIGKIKFEGKESKNPFSFRYYDAEKEVYGRKMKDWFKFSMAYWHTLCAEGMDPFATDEKFSVESGSRSHRKGKKQDGCRFRVHAKIDRIFLLSRYRPGDEGIHSRSTNQPEADGVLRQGEDGSDGYQVVVGTANVLATNVT